jgi:hypothetical protein
MPVLTGLIPTLYNSLDVVQRELIGIIPNVTMDATASTAAVNQVVRSPIVPQGTTENIVPGVTAPNTGQQTIAFQDVTITKSKAYPILWSGEETLQVQNNGLLPRIFADQVTQGFRTILNEVEADLALLYRSACRSTGTPGTTPFATAGDMTDWSRSNQILDDNGAPQTGRAMVIGSAARVNLEGRQSGLFRVNEAGDGGAQLRNRVVRELQGFQMGFSGAIRNQVVRGTGASYTTSGAPLTVGQTVIPLITGTGTILAGDSITFAGDANNTYVVTVGIAAPGSITIAAPGIQAVVPATNAVTVGNNFVPNMFFHQDALLLAARAPAYPVDGDMADDRTTITDPMTGMTFEIAVYKQYKQIKYEIGLAWGVAAPNPKYLGILRG